MPRPPIWAVEVRCNDGDQPPLIAEVPAHSALEALESTVADLVAAPPGPLNTAGAEIRQRREAAKMSQAQLAKAVGVSPATISTAERVLGGVTPQTMGRIRTALDEAGA